jgi:hypothetical protein
MGNKFEALERGFADVFSKHPTLPDVTELRYTRFEATFKKCRSLKYFVYAYGLSYSAICVD